jgi:peptidoglycan hydrolase-like protein with peptidoglycan-binding domain
MRDGLGDLIRLGEPAPIPPGLIGRTDVNRTIGAGQRALSKLGYAVAADGIMGPGTRQAIEQFERDRRLPVTGEFGPQTVRALTAQSGIQVD